MHAQTIDNSREETSITFPLLSLPNETLTNIIRMLSMADRTALRSVNERLQVLDQKAGFRNFESVIFLSLLGHRLTFGDENQHFNFEERQLRRISDTELYQVFHHGWTGQLKIEDTMNADAVRRLQAFKTLSFQKLKVYFLKDYSGKCLLDIVRGRNSVEEVCITWHCLDKEVEEAKTLLMALPTTKKLKIFHEGKGPLIDDGILKHLVGSSSNSTIYSKTCTITSVGIARAFEIIWSSVEYKESAFYAPAHFLLEFRRKLDSRFEVSQNVVTHKESGAYLICKFDKLEKAKSSDRFFVDMYTAKKTNTA